jgi:hypothetical protein
MKYTLTLPTTDPASVTLSGYRQARFVRGWIVTNRIVFPRCGSAGAPVDLL